MERRRERVSRGLLLITLLLLLLYNLLIFPRPTVEKPSNNEKGEYFTTGDSLDSQTRHSWAENKGKDVQNRDSEAKNKAKPDELESARQTNKLRLQHLERACEEVGNGQLYLLVQSFVAILKRIISWDRLILSISNLLISPHDNPPVVAACWCFFLTYSSIQRHGSNCIFSRAQ